MSYWAQYCEPPRPRPQGMLWDVFVSYRSLDRAWAASLYDMLVQCGYTTFLDQYVLVAGRPLSIQLGKHLQASASGVLIWSKRASDSGWVENELGMMVQRWTDTRKDNHPFNFVVSCLDDLPPPGLTAQMLYLSFVDYPDGPTGGDLVRLTAGLQGKPINPAAVQQLIAYDEQVKVEPPLLRALGRTGRFDEIVQKVASDAPAYSTAATIPSVAVQVLINAKQYRRALDAIAAAQARFPGSLRLRQLKGLALRRDAQLNEAIFELELLREQGYDDPETLGMLAATQADLWEIRSKNGEPAARDSLERARDLYREGFDKVPSDTYVGINAASKSALLGELDMARRIAADVLKRLSEIKLEHGGKYPDYWTRATEPEALLLAGEYERALSLYHDARIAYQHEAGSVESTAKQLERLLRVLPVPDGIASSLRNEFAIPAPA